MFPHVYFPTSYYGPAYFGGAGGLSAGDITSTRKIQLPIDCVLAGQQPYKFSGREYDIRPMSTTERVQGRRSRVRKLRGAKPSFTTTTNNRGYD